MSNPKTKLEQKVIDQKIARLPKSIVCQHRIMHLEVKYDFDTVDRWYLGYSSVAPFPKKRVFMFYEEPNLDACIMKAWRHLAEHKSEWRA